MSVARACALGTQACSHLCTTALLLSDHSTMVPAAISESLTTVQSILNACSVSVDATCALGNASATFLDTLLSHILRPSLLAHMHASACQLPDLTSVADMQSSHCTVLAWLVLFWQVMEFQQAHDGVATGILADQMLMNTIVEILCLICSRFKMPQAAGILVR